VTGETRVLVVDDEAAIVRALSVNLTALGYKVDAAGSGEEALRKAADHRPDAVILDLGLPGIDGIEVIRGLRGWSRVPIIVLSVRESEREKVTRWRPGPTITSPSPLAWGS
jgi:two-component system KDP operon response regulator KdpE